MERKMPWSVNPSGKFALDMIAVSRVDHARSGVGDVRHGSRTPDHHLRTNRKW